MSAKKNIIQSTQSGRLYIKTADFFQQEAVKSLIQELMNSSIYKSIVERKSHEAEQALKASK